MLTNLFKFSPLKISRYTYSSILWFGESASPFLLPQWEARWDNAYPRGSWESWLPAATHQTKGLTLWQQLHHSGYRVRGEAGRLSSVLHPRLDEHKPSVAEYISEFWLLIIMIHTNHGRIPISWWVICWISLHVCSWCKSSVGTVYIVQWWRHTV